MPTHIDNIDISTPPVIQFEFGPEAYSTIKVNQEAETSLQGKKYTEVRVNN